MSRVRHYRPPTLPSNKTINPELRFVKCKSIDSIILMGDYFPACMGVSRSGI